MYLSLWIVLISIIIYLISNSLLNFLFSNKSYDSYEELFSSGENIDDSLIKFQKNHEKNRFLGIRNVPDNALSYILSRTDPYKAILLYNIAKDYIFFNKERNLFEMRDSSNIIFDKENLNDCQLTINEKGTVAYIFWSLLSVLLMYFFAYKFNSDISKYYNEFILILCFCFCLLFIFIGASHIIRYQRLKCAKEFVELD